MVVLGVAAVLLADGSTRTLPLSPAFLGVVAILAGLTALCLAVALPFAISNGAPLAVALLGAGLIMALITLAAAVPCAAPD